MFLFQIFMVILMVSSSLILLIVFYFFKLIEVVSKLPELKISHWVIYFTDRLAHMPNDI